MGKLLELRGDLAVAHGLRTYVRAKGGPATVPPKTPPRRETPPPSFPHHRYDALRGLLKGVNRVGFGTGRLMVRAEVKGLDFLKHLPPGLGELGEAGEWRAPEWGAIQSRSV